MNSFTHFWFELVETKGYPLEQLDPHFEEKCKKSDDHVVTAERRLRKSRT
jgi:hypothetical protein